MDSMTSRQLFFRIAIGFAVVQVIFWPLFSLTVVGLMFFLD
jgi:nitrate reductase NapE component